eukprot:Nitzschia sp. Nitz4//scaffold341_size29662//28115//29509//NITZ4_008044-RA/size29662-processed-gene-0.24-mRNA-1//1//CDS//3329548564//3536//frame0
MSPPSSSLPITLLAGIVLGSTCTYALLCLSKGSPKKSRKESKRGLEPAAKSIPKELREEQLSRHTLYFGEDGIKSIQKAKVCVVGLGGVGSHTAVMLARGGIQERLRLIDFDQVTLSSLNRHACATLADVGIPKVTCVARFCQELGVTAETRVEMYTQETGPTLLATSPDNKEHDWDMVIDCIDDVPTKAALLTYCIQNKIRVLSCMGAGGKSDMTRLHISDLRTAAKDPLASKLRQTMKRLTKGNPAFTDDTYLDDMDQLTILYSSEMSVAKLADLTESQKGETDKSQFGNVDGMRIRVLPVLGPMPAIMGQSLASMAMCELGDKPIPQPVTGERIGRTVRHRKFQHLKRREEQINKGSLQVVVDKENAECYKGPLEMDIDDIEYLMGVWRNCCAVTGARLGTVLEFVRWDWTLPARPDNMVLMSSHAIKAYDEKGRSSIPEPVQKRIEKRLAAVREQSGQVF